MGERKVLNKYYPPDFDPSKLPRVRRPKNQQIKVRMMLPMSIRCNTCGNYIYKGTKFNSRKEDVIGETYLGIQIFRFYFKCTRCSAELTMKTDPQNSDYIVESGATRNFEPWREEDEATDKEKRKRSAEELGDAMKSLENRTLDSKREMDILAALDEMKSMKSRHATVSIDSMLGALQRTVAEKEKVLEEEDEALIKSIVFKNSKDYVKRIPDDEFEDTYDVTHQLTNNVEVSGFKDKKQKFVEESSSDLNNNTIKAAICNSLTDKGHDSSINSCGDNGSVSKSLQIRVSIIKKPVSTHQVPIEKKQRKDDEKVETAIGLQLLSQSYGSDSTDED